VPTGFAVLVAMALFAAAAWFHTVTEWEATAGYAKPLNMVNNPAMGAMQRGAQPTPKAERSMAMP
jgi:hypothetical protein